MEPTTRMLRFRFDYFDGRPSVYGEWNAALNGAAALTNKTNLRRFAIESLEPASAHGIKVAAECDGHDFVNFSWVCFTHHHIGRTSVVGAEMKTRESITEVYFDGTTRTLPRPADDMQFHYAGFGR